MEASEYQVNDAEFSFKCGTKNRYQSFLFDLFSAIVV
jgi:hypothetical protein